MPSQWRSLMAANFSQDMRRCHRSCLRQLSKNFRAQQQAVIAMHLLPHAGVEEPIHQIGTPDAKRILEILVRSGTVAINGNRKA